MGPDIFGSVFNSPDHISRKGTAYKPHTKKIKITNREMKTEFLNIKEVEVTEKETIKYYLLFKYDSKQPPEYRYFLWNQGYNVIDIESMKKDEYLNEGEQWRVFVTEIPL